jgi:manganese/zinc/iron transport system ATP- binding protein
MTTPFALSLHDVSVAYEDEPVLAHVNIDIAAGQLVGVVGPNGAGKSTLLNAILGIAPVVRGEIRLNGLPVEKTRKRLAYMPQREAVDWSFPVTVDEVVAMGRENRIGWFHRATRADRAVVGWALDQVGLRDLSDRPIAKLSGGQQQRVFLARALAQEGDVLLLDEPLTGVDATTQETILSLLQEFQRNGKTVLMTTHDLGVARAFCSSLLFVNRALIAYGPTAQIFSTDNLERTYGGHIVRVRTDGTPAATLEDALVTLRDDTHHAVEGKH